MTSAMLVPLGLLCKPFALHASFFEKSNFQIFSLAKDSSVKYEKACTFDVISFEELNFILLVQRCFY